MLLIGIICNDDVALSDGWTVEATLLDVCCGLIFFGLFVVWGVLLHLPKEQYFFMLDNLFEILQMFLSGFEFE